MCMAAVGESGLEFPRRSRLQTSKWSLSGARASLQGWFSIRNALQYGRSPGVGMLSGVGVFPKERASEWLRLGGKNACSQSGGSGSLKR